MNCHDYVDYACAFTKQYRLSANKYVRETECLKIQFGYAVLPMRDGDQIAGRYEELPLGFSPQSDLSVGYYLDENFFTRLAQDPELTGDEQAELRDLIAYWKEENTQNKIYREYPEQILRLLTHNQPFETPATAFALYRLSGAQMDPTKLFREGVTGLIRQASAAKEKNPDFYQGIAEILGLFREVCLRYGREAEENAARAADPEKKAVWHQVAENMRVIADDKPHTFRQALQLSYLYMVLSGTRNYGRMDLYLGDYLQADLDSGVLTEETALDCLMNVWSLLAERNHIFDTRVILGGKDRPNAAAADRFALLALEATRRSRAVVPQLTLRCHSGMNPDVYDKALQVIGEGTTFPILYNDDLNIPMAAEAFGIDEATAQRYVPYGCGEYVIYNQSLGTPSGTLNLLHGLNSVIYGEKRLLLTAKDFKEFYRLYLEEMAQVIHWLAVQEKMEYDICGREAAFLFYSVLFDDCMARGLPLLEGGIRYLGGTLETYGNINTSDSLTAIKQMVFEQKRVCAQTLTDALQANFAGFESLQQELRDLPKFGNDDAAADSMAVRLHEDICSLVRGEAVKIGLSSYLLVIINNSMNSVFGLGTGASADGRPANTYMANANNPMGGMDKNGVTAMLNSLVKLRVNRHAGSVQNMRFSKEMFGPMLGKTKGLLQAYFDNGGSQAMITVLGRGDLEAALEEPEKYQNLIVRVGGFSARFVELPGEVQRELLSRTLY